MSNNTLLHQINDALRRRKDSDRWDIFPTDNPLIYTVTCMPPDTSYWGGGLFFINISFPPQYPFAPPRPTMTTTIFHPNVCDIGKFKGMLHPHMLYDGWTPLVTVRKLIKYLVRIFLKPDLRFFSVANHQAADLYRYNRIEFEKKAKEYTTRYAI